MKQGTVLIVDDESGVRDVLRDILEDEGYTVVAVGSAMAALEEVERRNFDVAVVDVLLPRTSGLSLVRRLREQNPQIVPIAVTGYPSPEVVELAASEKLYDYIVKPIDKSRLCTTVANALETKRLAEQEAKSKATSKQTPDLTEESVESERESTNNRLRSDRMRTLRNCELFETFSDRQLQNILGLCEVRSYEAGQTIYHQDTPSEEVYIVQEGSVALTRSIRVGDTEQLMTVDLLGKGKVLGWTALIEPHVHMDSAICQSPSKVLAANGFELRFVLVREPTVGFEIMERLCMLVTSRLRVSYSALESKG